MNISSASIRWLFVSSRSNIGTAGDQDEIFHSSMDLVRWSGAGSERTCRYVCLEAPQKHGGERFDTVWTKHIGDQKVVDGLLC
jgi:hypothetical protein